MSKHMRTSMNNAFSGYATAFALALAAGLPMQAQAHRPVQSVRHARLRRPCPGSGCRARLCRPHTPRGW